MESDNIVEISPFDTKTIINDQGQEIETSILIPECCRENWDSCPHGVKRQKPIKTNIGL